MARPKKRKATGTGSTSNASVVFVLMLVGVVLCALHFRGALSPIHTSLGQQSSLLVACEEKKPSPDDKLPKIMTDSTNATVMGFATGYRLPDYRIFVGSLRKSGFKGHIILGVAPDIDEESMAYLASKKVRAEKVQFIPCTHGMFDDEVKDEKELDSHEKEVRTCVAPYDKLKSRWGRFPWLRDRLKECEGCTGPVLVTDVRDTFFQRDPFGDGQPQVEGLQVFEEHKKMTTKNWLVEWPVRECKGIVYDKPMLCSGTTIGTREATMSYLTDMETEMNIWMADKKCHFKTNGDDQSIHNYLYYSGKLGPDAKAIPNGVGIVNTVGYQAAVIRAAHRKRMEEKGLGENDPFPGTTKGTKPWITQEYDMTDEEGYILDFDGQKSSVVHQYDRFGFTISYWLEGDSGLLE